MKQKTLLVDIVVKDPETHKDIYKVKNQPAETAIKRASRMLGFLMIWMFGVQISLLFEAVFL